MRIVQINPFLAYGDAVGNDTLALCDTLKESGYNTKIYAVNKDNKIKSSMVAPIEEYKNDKDDIILYHLSTGTEWNHKVLKYKGKKVFIYHNMTPPEYFELYDKKLYDVVKEGINEVAKLGDRVEYCIADSEFNKQDLIRMGYTCPIDVLPILIAFDDYKKKPNRAVIDKYNDGWTNIVFTGRVVPNKKHEDIIAAFAYYKENINPRSRLILVGNQSAGATATYFRRLKQYARYLEVEDVIFTGHVMFDEILAYYNVADVFLCMSEHEGFCVPLVEAMWFKIPIIAFDSTAVGETLGGSGLLLDTKEPAVVAGAINKIVTDPKLRQQLIDNQSERLKYFEHERIKKEFLKIIKRITGDM